MSLPASQQRVLSRIEEALQSRDPRLKTLFSTFTRLTGHEAMPATEQLRPAGWLRRQPGAVIMLGLTLVLAIVVVGSLGGSGRLCGSAGRPPANAVALGHGCVARTTYPKAP